MFSAKSWVLAVGIATAGLMLVPQPADAAADKQADKKAKKAATKKADDSAALFKKLDTNNDGKVSPAEFAKLTEIQAAAKAEKKKAKPAKKADKATQVALVDKQKKANKAAKPANKKKNKQADKTTGLFKQLDTNNDGFLSLDEFKKMAEVEAKAKAAKPKKAKKATK